MGQKQIAVPMLVVFALLAAPAGSSFAQIEIPRITIQELKGVLDEGTSVVILDTQPKVVYEKGHIKGALSFPWKTRITAQDTAGLPHNKLIVTYCDCGPGEADSTHMAAQTGRSASPTSRCCRIRRSEAGSRRAIPWNRTCGKLLFRFSLRGGVPAQLFARPSAHEERPS